MCRSEHLADCLVIHVLVRAECKEVGLTTCEGSGDVVHVLTLLVGGGVALTFRDDRVVELKEQLGVEEEDGEHCPLAFHCQQNRRVLCSRCSITQNFCIGKFVLYTLPSFLPGGAAAAAGCSLRPSRVRVLMMLLASFLFRAARADDAPCFLRVPYCAY